MSLGDGRIVSFPQIFVFQALGGTIISIDKRVAWHKAHYLFILKKQKGMSDSN